MDTDETPSAERLALFLMELRSRNVRDTILLSACEKVPRERFLRSAVQPLAYRDVELPIGCGQSAPSPFDLMRRLNALAVRPRDMVLEIGAGSGYQTALLGFCARRVIAVERYRTLALEAARRLTELGIGNASVRQGDGSEGMAVHGPYDVIVVNAGISAVPQRLGEQLSAQGRMLAPIGPAGEERWILTRRTEAGESREDLGRAAILPLAAGLAEIL